MTKLSLLEVRNAEEIAELLDFVAQNWANQQMVNIVIYLSPMKSNNLDA